MPAAELAWVGRVAETLTSVNNDPWLKDKVEELGPAGGLMMLRQHDQGLRGVWGIYAPGAEVFPVETPRAVYYMNRNGEFLYRADPGYAVASPYSEGAAAMGSVQPTLDKDNLAAQFEYVDIKGDNAVPGYYAEARPFKNGLAVAGRRDGQNKKWLGMIDKSGQWVIEPRFDVLFEFVDDLAAAQISNPDHTADTAGFIDRAGKFVVTLEGVQRMLSSHHHGLALVWLTGTPKYVFVDRAGKVVLTPQYDQVEPFYEGRAAVARGGVWGFIDSRGEEVVPLQYWMVTPFENGMSAVIVKSPDTPYFRDGLEGVFEQ